MHSSYYGMRVGGINFSYLCLPRSWIMAISSPKSSTHQKINVGSRGRRHPLLAVFWQEYLFYDVKITFIAFALKNAFECVTIQKGNNLFNPLQFNKEFYPITFFSVFLRLW